MAGFLVTVVGGIAVVVLLLIALGIHSRPSGSSRRDGGDSNNDGGSWTHESPRPHSPSGGDDEPAWWPEFEREFRSYAARYAHNQKVRARTQRSRTSRRG